MGAENRKTAYNLIRHLPAYPWQAVEQGVVNSGDELIQGYTGQVGGDNSAVITWHPYGHRGKAAQLHRSRSGKHIVCENGYIRKTPSDEPCYLMEFNGMNGRGWVPGGDGSRFDLLGINPKPFKKHGEHILICAQRGGSYSEYSMPLDWPEKVVGQIRTQTDRQIIYRPHPGRRRESIENQLGKRGIVISNPGIRSLADDLSYAWAVVVWCSNCATEALIAGVPVFYCAPTIKLDTLALQGVRCINTPYIPTDEARMFRLKELAWSVWTLGEIEAGLPWRYLMHR